MYFYLNGWDHISGEWQKPISQFTKLVRME